MDDFFMMIIFIIAALAVFSFMRKAMSSSRPTSSSSTTTASPRPQAVSKTQMAEDMKATQTSQVVDAVSILDDLGSTSSNYRHYCELVGTSMATSNIIAPYSKRAVAYYDIKCYRIDATYGGGQEETLVAHEHSFDPFFFTDASCDTPIYIDLESFGNNVILVNSTNHIEGPNSDFSKAFQKNASTATSSSSGAAYACVAQTVARGANVLLGAAHALRNALTPRPLLQPALALAGGADMPASRTSDTKGSNIMFANHAGSGTSHGKGGGRPPQGRPPQGPPPQGRGQVSINFGYGNPMPGHMGNFMGPSHQPFVIGGGYTTHRPPSGSNSSDVILAMSLGALLNSMANNQQATQGYTTSTDTFRGYRLVENIVPLGSPIYCIGEIYRHGTDVYMSRSLAKDYPTSYFATKPESEVLSAIGNR